MLVASDLMNLQIFYLRIFQRFPPLFLVFRFSLFRALIQQDQKNPHLNKCSWCVWKCVLQLLVFLFLFEEEGNRNGGLRGWKEVRRVVWIVRKESVYICFSLLPAFDNIHWMDKIIDFLHDYTSWYLERRARSSMFSCFNCSTSLCKFIF